MLQHGTSPVPYTRRLSQQPGEHKTRTGNAWFFWVGSSGLVRRTNKNLGGSKRDHFLKEYISSFV